MKNKMLIIIIILIVIVAGAMGLYIFSNTTTNKEEKADNKANATETAENYDPDINLIPEGGDTEYAVLSKFFEEAFRTCVEYDLTDKEKMKEQKKLIKKYVTDEDYERLNKNWYNEDNKDQKVHITNFVIHQIAPLAKVEGGYAEDENGNYIYTIGYNADLIINDKDVDKMEQNKRLNMAVAIVYVVDGRYRIAGFTNTQ